MSELTHSTSLIALPGRAIVEASSNRPRLLALRSPGRRITVMKAVETPRRDVVEEQLTVPGGPTGEVHVRVVKPARPRRELWTIVYNIDDAGRAGADAVTHRRVICELAIAVDATVVVPTSCLSAAPHHPTAIEERYAVARWAADRGPVLGIDGCRLARSTETARAIGTIRADLTGYSDPIPSVRSPRDGNLRDGLRAA